MRRSSIPGNKRRFSSARGNLNAEGSGSKVPYQMGTLRMSSLARDISAKTVRRLEA